MTPDRRPIHFIGSLANLPITPDNPHGLHPSWRTPVPGWLQSLAHSEAERVMVARPAGWTAPAGEIRFAHWLTMTQAQRDEMASASAAWIAAGKQPMLYFGRLISPPDTLDLADHEDPTFTADHLEWVRASLLPYRELGFTGFGVDAGSALSPELWHSLTRMIRLTTWAPWIAAEAIPQTAGTGNPDHRRLLREPSLCLWEYLDKPASNPRWQDPDWVFDPAQTEVHCILTGAQAAVAGRVQMLEDRGYVVGCRNNWWR